MTTTNDFKFRDARHTKAEDVVVQGGFGVFKGVFGIALLLSAAGIWMFPVQTMASFNVLSTLGISIVLAAIGLGALRR